MSAQGCRWIQSSGSGPDGLDRSQISRNKSKRKNCTGHGIFYIPFTQFFCARKASRYMKKRTCLSSTSNLAPNSTGLEKASRCPFRHFFLRFQLSVDAFARFKPFGPGTYYDWTSNHRAARRTRWPTGFQTRHGRQSQAAWQTTKIFCIHEPCREHCWILVPASRVLQARIKQCRTAGRQAAKENREILCQPYWKLQDHASTHDCHDALLAPFTTEATGWLILIKNECDEFLHPQKKGKAIAAAEQYYQRNPLPTGESCPSCLPHLMKPHLAPTWADSLQLQILRWGSVSAT